MGSISGQARKNLYYALATSDPPDKQETYWAGALGSVRPPGWLRISTVRQHRNSRAGNAVFNQAPFAERTGYEQPIGEATLGPNPTVIEVIVPA